MIKHMENTMPLGKSGLQVPRLGMGAMVWGQPTGMARWTPAQLAYGPSHSPQEEERALAASLAAGVNLVDTAAMYSGGASERRVGELARSKDVLIATKFPGGFSFRAEGLPKELDASLARLGCDSIDLHQHHFPTRGVAIPQLMSQLADAVEAGKVRADRKSTRLNSSHQLISYAVFCLKKKIIRITNRRKQTKKRRWSLKQKRKKA